MCKFGVSMCLLCISRIQEKNVGCDVRRSRMVESSSNVEFDPEGKWRWKSPDLPYKWDLHEKRLLRSQVSIIDQASICCHQWWGCFWSRDWARHHFLWMCSDPFPWNHKEQSVYYRSSTPWGHPTPPNCRWTPLHRVDPHRSSPCGGMN